jgi:hypothetical protein
MVSSDGMAVSPHTPGHKKCCAAWFDPSHQEKWGCAASWAARWVGRPTAAEPMIAPVVLAV